MLTETAVALPVIIDAIVWFEVLVDDPAVVLLDPICIPFVITKSPITPAVGAVIVPEVN